MKPRLSWKFKKLHKNLAEWNTQGFALGRGAAFSALEDLYEYLDRIRIQFGVEGMSIYRFAEVVTGTLWKGIQDGRYTVKDSLLVIDFLVFMLDVMREDVVEKMKKEVKK